MTASGVVDSRGETWWPSRDAMTGAEQVKRLRREGSLDPRDYEPAHQFLRPKLLKLIGCRRVLLEGVTFRNPPNWTLNPTLCEDLMIRNITVHNVASEQNTDGLDVESCRNVIVRDSSFDVGDDGICLKSGQDAPGRRIGVPTENVLIERCVVYHGHGGLTIGSEMSGGVRNVRRRGPDGSRVTGEGKIVWEIEPDLPALEGPKLYQRNGWYYILAPSGGVATGWQIVLRSRQVYGPYQEKVVLAQRGTPVNGPHQGALVDTPQGEWWFVHFQDMDLYGRVVHLQPVRWENDWPLIGVDQDDNGTGRPLQRHPKPNVGKSYPSAIPQTTDAFDGARLGPQWQWHANHEDSWYSLSARPGHLRLYPQFVLRGDFSQAGNLLLQKFPAHEFTAETVVELPQGHAHLHAGLLVMGREHAALDVQHGPQGYNLRLLSKGETLAHLVTPGGAVRLRVAVGEGGVCRFGVVQEGGLYNLGPAFHARPGVWIGAKVGLYCLTPDVLNSAGHADFAYFRLGGSPSAQLSLEE